jgi:hypothetical protein
MGRLGDLLKSLTGGRRPPTGPLTTSEAGDAEELRLHDLAEEGRRVPDPPGAGEQTGAGSSE